MNRTSVVVILASLARVARADEPAKPDVEPSDKQRAEMEFSSGETVQLTGGSYRSTAEEFLVLPEGIDVGGKLRTVMADGGMGPGKIKLTDLALFDVTAQWAVARHYELDATLTVLPKQPSTTTEPIVQGGSLALRRDVAARTAVGLGGSVGPLLGMAGLAYGGSALVIHKHRLNEVVTFALTGGADAMLIRPSDRGEHPFLVEAAGHAAVLARVPHGPWGGWMGVGYAVPVFHRGHDPVSGMALAPQPRLDLDIGNAVQLADYWDLAVDLAIIDRGDLASPATRLPVLDGGFDQIQLIVAISRRFHQHSSDYGDPLLMY